MVAAVSANNMDFNETMVECEIWVNDLTVTRKVCKAG
jgi:hypothetical protein